MKNRYGAIALCFRWLLVVTVLLSVASPALAQVCFNKPQSVPGLENEPVWKPPSPQTRLELHEPRWGAAPLRAFAGAGSDAGFRVVSNADGTELTFSFQVFSDPAGLDRVYLALSQTSPALQAVATRIAIPSIGTGTAGQPTDIEAIDYWSWTGSEGMADPVSGWTDLGGSASWVDYPMAWVKAPGGGVEWAVNFKVTLMDVGIDPASPFKIFLGVTTGGIATSFSTPDAVAPLVPDTIIPANPLNWALAEPVHAGCPGGVEIYKNGIGTTNLDSDGDPTPNLFDIDDGAENTIYAKPIYGALVPPGSVHATFRMANWGSVASPEADWDTLGVDTMAASGDFSISCVNGGGNINCGGSSTPLPPIPHQCVNVSLSRGPGSQIVMTKPSAYRNMIFKSLSKITETAIVSLKSAKSALGTHPDLYFYVKKSNMPIHGEQKHSVDVEKLSRLRRVLHAPPIRVGKPGAVDLQKGPNAPKPEPVGAVGGRGNLLAQAAAVPAAPVPAVVAAAVDGEVGPGRDPLTGHQHMTDVWPTYEVFPYYDSGERFNLEGRERKRLRAMTPFGMYLTHEGIHYGFKEALEVQAGATLEEISPDFYKVVYPKTGPAEVKLSLTLSAEEKPLSASGSSGSAVVCPDCVNDAIERHKVENCHCRLVGTSAAGGAGLSSVLLILLGGILLSRRRRK